MRSKYILKRLLYVIPVALGVLIVIFILLRSMPGDFTAALLGPEARPEDIMRVRE